MRLHQDLVDLLQTHDLLAVPDGLKQRGDAEVAYLPQNARSLDIGRFLTSYIDAIPPPQKPSIFLCLGRKYCSL